MKFLKRYFLKDLNAIKTQRKYFFVVYIFYEKKIQNHSKKLLVNAKIDTSFATNSQKKINPSFFFFM